jgi:hypothetical protein
MQGGNVAKKINRSCVGIALAVVLSALWMIAGSILIALIWHEWAWSEFVRGTEGCPSEGDGGPCTQYLGEVLEHRRLQAVIWAIPAAAGVLTSTWFAIWIARWVIAKRQS